MGDETMGMGRQEEGAPVARAVRRATAMIAPLLVGLALLAATPFGLALNLTDSLPRGLWALTYDDGLARMGAGRVGALVDSGRVVALTPPERAVSVCGAREGVLFLKQVAGGPGQTVCVDAHGEVAVDEVTVARSELTPGEPSPLWLNGCLTLAPGQVWVSTPSPRSCDSRVFGPLPTLALEATATPLMTAP
jgi:type IV secretory pathway protease TraF